MKKSIFLILALLLLNINSFAQKEIEFKSRYLSNTEYTTEIQNVNKSKAEFSGPKEFLDNLKKQGVDNPQKTKESSIIKVLYKTGESEDGSFPIEMEYINAGKAGEAGGLINGDKIFGIYNNDNTVEITEFSNKSLTDEYKESMLIGLNFGFSTSLFEGKKMKIGDTLNQNSILSFPIAGSNFDMNIKTTYKLKKIKKGTAHFDLVQTGDVNFSDQDFQLNGNLKGKGKCVYDIDENQLTSNSSSFTLDMKTSLRNDIEINLTMISTANTKTSVKKL